MKNFFMILRQHGLIVDVKNRNKSAILIYQPLLNLSENWSFATCITNFVKIHKQILKLSRPQGEIIYVKCDKLQ